MSSTHRKTQALLRSFLLIGIVVVINVIAVRVFGRLDLTAQSVFTLAKASKDLVETLDDRVTVRAYFTENLPAPHNEKRRAVLDILNEYKAYGGRNFQFEFINPEGEEGEREAQQQRILPIQAQVIYLARELAFLGGPERFHRLRLSLKDPPSGASWPLRQVSTVRTTTPIRPPLPRTAPIGSDRTRRCERRRVSISSGSRNSGACTRPPS